MGKYGKTYGGWLRNSIRKKPWDDVSPCKYQQTIAKVGNMSGVDQKVRTWGDHYIGKPPKTV